mmetsp:Transcript_7670/g.8129  ORF Transcript_7670/g.8129 Transcript_7670/m.8129 type:complete len:104 (+) Transcript_7670:762-1073(+)
MPTLAKKAVSAIVKKQAHELTGTGVDDDDYSTAPISSGMTENEIESNPYMPRVLKGSGLQKYGIPITTHSDSSNLVPIDTDSFHPDYRLTNAYSNPVNYSFRK